MDHAAPSLSADEHSHVPDGEVKLILTDLVYFVDEGLGKLLRAMLRQSLKDILQDRSDPRAPVEVSSSARWPKSPDGVRSIEFLMPSISSERVVARMYSNTEQMLQAFEQAEFERANQVHSPNTEPSEETYSVAERMSAQSWPGQQSDDAVEPDSQPGGSFR